MKKPTSGFTLIELMIVVAIIAVLASIAFPQYQNYVMKTNRSEAKGLLLELTHYMERRFTEQGAYCEDTPCAVTPADLDLPFTTSPKNSPNNYAHYLLSLVATGGNELKTTRYTLLAEPQGPPQSESNQAVWDTDCGRLSINQANVKCIKVIGIGTGGVCSNSTDQLELKQVANCW